MSNINRLEAKQRSWLMSGATDGEGVPAISRTRLAGTRGENSGADRAAGNSPTRFAIKSVGLEKITAGKFPRVFPC